MTLSLYGKSRRHQGGLLLLGLLAIVAAVAVAAVFRTNTLADETDVGNIQVHKYLPKDPPPESGQAPWQNQGVGQGAWTFTVYPSLADAQADTNALASFSQLGANSPDLPQTDLWIKETGMPDGQSFYGWFIPDGDTSSGNDKCNQAPLDFVTGGAYSTEPILFMDAAYWQTKGNQPGLFHICAYDKPTVTKTIIIEKRFVEIDGYTPDATDFPTFTFDPAIEPAPVCTVDASLLPGIVRWTCTVPASWNGTVTETPAAGWASVTCDAPSTDANFVFCNIPYGTVHVHKLNTSAAGPNFEAVISGGAFPGNDIYGSPLDSSPAIAQGSPSEQTGVPLSSVPINVTEVNAGTVETCGSGATNYFTIVQGPVDTVLDTPGEIQEWTIVNQPCGVLGQGGITLHKHRDNWGDGIFNDSDAHESWTLRITGPNGYDETFVIPADENPYLVGGLEPGDYTVSELTQAGWRVIGATVDEGPLVAGVTQVTVAVDGELNVLRGVTFYNQPRVNIEVNKNEISSATPSGGPGAGWSYTLTGCGIAPQVGVTGADGKAVFSDLPPAVGCAYTVTEAVQTGWVALTPVQTTSPVNPGQVAVLNFTNVKTEVPDVTPTPVPPAETSTPVPPTATPVPPTETPVPPTQTPSGDVLGEITPAPPVAGTGTDSGGSESRMNLLLLAATLFALSGAMTLAVAGRRRSS